MSYLLPTPGGDGVAIYPYTFQNLKDHHPGVSFGPTAEPADFLHFGAKEVVDVEPPGFDPVTHVLVEGEPVYLDGDWLQTWAIVDRPPGPTQFEQDQRRYERRAEVRDSLMAYMAADNMSRVRTGAWTVPDLVGLIADPAVSSALSFMASLSYELAAQSIDAATHPLLSPEIKADWIAKLTEHFYLEG